MSTPHEFEVADGVVALVLDLRVYRLSAVKKAAYRFADRFSLNIGSPDHDQLRLALLFKPATSDAAAREITRTFLAELLDQELREQIAEETLPIRSVILAQAFSKLDLIKRNE